VFVEDELEMINQVIEDHDLGDKLRTEVDRCDARGLYHGDRIDLVNKYANDIMNVAGGKIDYSMLLLYLNYVFGSYWATHKHIKKACDTHFPDLKKMRTYGVRGEVDYLRAIAQREVLESTLDLLNQLKITDFDDPGGQIMRKLTLASKVNDIVVKQGVLRYEVEADMTLDTPNLRDVLDRDTLAIDIDKAFLNLKKGDEE